MEDQRSHQWIFGLSFFAVLIGLPIVLVTLVPTIVGKLDINAGFWFVTWITASSIFLQFWVFCRWSGKGPDKAWKAVLILHALIIPGMYGVEFWSLFSEAVQASMLTTVYFWVWGIGSLLLSLWLPFTKPFALVDAVNKRSRLFVVPVLVFLPEVFAVVVVYVSFAASGI